MQLLRTELKHLDSLLNLIENFYTHFNYPFDALRHRKLLEYFLENNHLGSIWLIYIEEEEIGYIALTYGFSFEFGGRNALIDEFFISEAYRNTGLGKLVLQEIQQKMESLDLCMLHLQTEIYNIRAKNLYESLGFQDFQRASLTYLKRIPIQ